VTHERAGQRGRDDEFAAHRGHDGVGDLVAVGVLREVAGGARAQRSVHERPVLVGRQEQHPRPAAGRADRLEDRDAVRVRHADVE
jgi:hypothetical protein